MIVQSLWIGNTLTDLEVYCIKSFLKNGFTFHLYTYDSVNRVPKGTIIKDANTILNKKTIFLLQDTYLPFSDIWRYKLMYEKGGYWVDMDMICIRPFDFKDEYVFASERTIKEGAYKMSVPHVANINILKAPKHSLFYKELFEKCMSLQNKKTNNDKIKYMRMLRKMIHEKKFKKYIKPPKYFCHLDWWYAKDAYMSVKHFRPKYGHAAKSINSMFSNNVYTIHLWRNLTTKKYKLNLNDTYPEDSLWEILKDYVDDL